MFPKLEKKFVILYTLSTGLILTLILAVAFLSYLASQNSRQNSMFQDQLFTLMSRLQSDSIFSDSYLAQLEHKNHLAIYIEENGSPFFFPGSYQTCTERGKLFERAENLAAGEGIFPNSHPISSNLLQSSLLEIRGDEGDLYLGNILIIQTANGYKKLILLQDISGSQMQSIKTLIFYLVIDCIGILLLFLTGRWFVRRSLKPLEETYEKQQDFVAAASHELRSPLAVIQSTADAIADAPEEEGRLLDVIRKECRRGSSLVKNLLLLAAADQKQWAVKKVYFEMDEMLLSLLEVYEPLCVSRNGKLLLELPDESMPKVYADPALCRQIFMILLDNAVAYGLGEDGGRIVLRATYLHPHVEVSVIDHGPGIPDGEKRLIFDRFYRQDQSRRQKEHFGLGLSVAATLAEIQGVELDVRDTEGGGSTFRVKI
ncbi:HAMP domain-containing histidine kinase [Schaedlerella arabinosiphila]|uniref:histidine kinase n=1 Tax=Schaedlerella arabinosiphila TaxID=2044587 RepID=A0A9X5C7C7_9FIRM|nr:HAMP domain-containing sensor histidine kinase [Schaedlerella arabinosiphila]NDO69435.1 HAMP domain-containing histidine kinase [Schaedlerella arabinosiphila]